MYFTYEKSVGIDRYIQFFYVLPLMNYTLNKALEYYKQLLEDIANKNQIIVFERIFGNQRYRRKLMAVNKALGHPVSFIEGNSVHDKPLAGVIIHAVDSGTEVRYIRERGAAYGSHYRIGAVDRLSVEGIQDPIKAANFSQAVLKEYEMVRRILRKAGFDTTDLVRTWHYIHPIKDCYIAFNKERRAFFNGSNIDYLNHPGEVPASTCIEGKGRGTGHSSMNLYYIKRSAEVRFQRIYNSEQKEADSLSYQYGPTFSRALHVAQPGLEELQISGTASIGEDGVTLYGSDPYRQIERTLLVVKGLLVRASMDFNDICYATCIFKEPADYKIFQEVARELHIPDFPHVAIQGNICREDLLFELDGVAVKRVNTDKNLCWKHMLGMMPLSS